MKQKGPVTLKRFLPLIMLLVLIIVVIGMGAKVKDKQASLLEEKSNAVIQERPPVNVASLSRGSGSASGPKPIV